MLFGHDGQPKRPIDAFRSFGYTKEMDALESQQEGQESNSELCTSTGRMMGADCMQAAVSMLNAERHFGKDR